MQRSEALISHLLNHFSMHPARITVMIEIILACIKVGSVQQQKIARGTSFKTKISSTTRRIQRFFAEQFLCGHIASKLIFSLFDWDKKIALTIDRTNWKFGKKDINFLVVCAIYKDYSIPICWILLPHRGNSRTSDRIDLIERLLLVIPANRIQSLLADREFIGVEWFQYLHAKGIPFCIRLKENMLVIDTRRGGMIKLQKLFRHLLGNQYREMEQVISGVSLRIFATRITKSGELLILAVSGDNNLLDAYELYSCRWTIETMFKAFKTAGFNFEDTHQQNTERLSKMMVLLTIAYAWAIKIGEIKNRLNPIRIKKHNRQEFSLFTYGFRVIQTILLKGIKFQQKLVNLIEKIMLNKTLLSHEMRVTVVY